MLFVLAGITGKLANKKGFDNTPLFTEDNSIYENSEKAYIPPTNFTFSFLYDSTKYNRSQIGSEVKLKIVGKPELGDDYILGTDYKGHDILFLLMYSCWNYIWYGSFALLLAIIIGLFLGVLSGFNEYKTPNIISKFLINYFSLFPAILILLIISKISSYNFEAILFTWSLIFSIKIAFLIEGKFEILYKNQFIIAEKEMGFSNFNIIKKVLLYNCRDIIFPQIIHFFIGVIAIESTLAYIGKSGDNWVTWGSLLYHGLGNGSTSLWDVGIYWIAAPVIFIIIISIIFLHFAANTIGNYFK